MTLTSHRIIQYIALILLFILAGGGYWYWQNAQAGVVEKAATSVML